MPEHDPFDPEMLRAVEFPRIADTIYLNAASVTPLPERARQAVDAYTLRRTAPHAMTAADFDPVLQRARQAAARMIGAEADEIALGGNTSFGLNLAALSLPVEPGRCVVASAGEFPSNVYPWMREHLGGARLELVDADALGRPDEARLMERLDRGDVGVFALSAVQFATGYRADLEHWGRFCRERGIFFVVDAIQALGAVPLDVRAMQIDVLACGGHKWLCAPFGTGFAYVRRELQESIEPRVIGWSSMQASADLAAVIDYHFEFYPDARRYEVATLPLQEFAGFAESLELLLEVGTKRIATHVDGLVMRLARGLGALPGMQVLSDLAPERRAGILALGSTDVEATAQALAAGGVTAVVREGAVRLAPHLYNTEAEMDRVIEILAREAR
jgi:selenocysteine lyase/cysteine desulfurase